MTDAKNGRKKSIREIEKHVKMYKSQGRCFEIQSIIVQRDILIIEIIIILLIKPQKILKKFPYFCLLSSLFHFFFSSIKRRLIIGLSSVTFKHGRKQNVWSISFPRSKTNQTKKKPTQENPNQKSTTWNKKAVQKKITRTKNQNLKKSS